jgi:hypothetical protein
MSLALPFARKLDTFTPAPNTAKNVTAVILSLRAALQLPRLTAIWHARATALNLVEDPAG